MHFPYKQTVTAALAPLGNALFHVVAVLLSLVALCGFIALLTGVLFVIGLVVQLVLPASLEVTGPAGPVVVGLGVAVTGVFGIFILMGLFAVVACVRHWWLDVSDTFQQERQQHLVRTNQHERAAGQLSVSTPTPPQGALSQPARPTSCRPS